jgi:hypothetical protein
MPSDEQVKAGFTVFTKRPNEVMLGLVVVFVMWQSYANSKQQERLESFYKEELAVERADHKANFERVVDHLKFLSDKLAPSLRLTDAN